MKNVNTGKSSVLQEMERYVVLVVALVGLLVAAHNIIAFMLNV